MMHAYASIWQCLMHDIVVEIRGKGCVHAHHTRVEIKQLSAIIERIYER